MAVITPFDLLTFFWLVKQMTRGGSDQWECL
jgi:hypothetical protein